MTLPDLLIPDWELLDVLHLAVLEARPNNPGSGGQKRGGCRCCHPRRSRDRCCSTARFLLASRFAHARARLSAGASWPGVSAFRSALRTSFENRMTRVMPLGVCTVKI